MKAILTSTIAATAMVTALTFASAGPAAAQLAGARIATHADTAGPLATPVQWRGRRWRGRYWRGPGWRYRRGWGWWGPGAFATGVIIGGALAAPPYYYRRRPAYAYDEAIAYCLRRFKSYDVESMTYLGYDGRRHPCP
jgi:hypothetical protein